MITFNGFHSTIVSVKLRKANILVGNCQKIFIFLQTVVDPKRFRTRVQANLLSATYRVNATERPISKFFFSF
jgi:hypothetical protein